MAALDMLCQKWVVDGKKNIRGQVERNLKSSINKKLRDEAATFFDHHILEWLLIFEYLSENDPEMVDAIQEQLWARRANLMNFLKCWLPTEKRADFIRSITFPDERCRSTSDLRRNAPSGVLAPLIDYLDNAHFNDHKIDEQRDRTLKELTMLNEMISGKIYDVSANPGLCNDDPPSFIFDSISEDIYNNVDWILNTDFNWIALKTAPIKIKKIHADIQVEYRVNLPYLILCYCNQTGILPDSIRDVLLSQFVGEVGVRPWNGSFLYCGPVSDINNEKGSDEEDDEPSSHLVEFKEYPGGGIGFGEIVSVSLDSIRQEVMKEYDPEKGGGYRSRFTTILRQMEKMRLLRKEDGKYRRTKVGNQTRGIIQKMTGCTAISIRERSRE